MGLRAEPSKNELLKVRRNILTYVPQLGECSLGGAIPHRVEKGEGLKQTHEQGEDVRFGIPKLTGNLFGGHIPSLSRNTFKVGQPLPRLRDPKIREFHLSHVREEDIGGGDIPMHNTVDVVFWNLQAVGVNKRKENLPKEKEGYLYGEGALKSDHFFEGVSQVHPLHPLKNDVVAPIGLKEIHHPHYIIVVEFFVEFSLGEEEFQDGGLMGEMREELFYSYGESKPPAALPHPTVDRPHTPNSQEFV